MVEYTQLDVTTRINAVRARIRELEQQYLQLDLRVQAPDLNQPASEMDNQNRQKLEEGLTRLHQMEQELSTPAPAPPQQQGQQ